MSSLFQEFMENHAAEHRLDEVKKAVAERGYETESLEYAVTEELVALWDDLDDAVRDAYNGVWSIRCDTLVARISMLTLELGKPTEWSRVPVRLLLNGVYETLHEAIGMPTPLSAEDRAYANKIYTDMLQSIASRYEVTDL